jgi:transposase InsO family protein
LVKPETILRWHREGFRLFWRWKSRSRKAIEPRISYEVIALIRRMARENRLWGAERIRGELMKLGITVAKRTIQRYLRAVRPAVPPRGQSWKTFLSNHTVWACDFLQVYDVWFRPLFAFFVIDIKSREVVHVAATRAPTERWTAQQLRNITSFGQGPDVIIRDRDSKFGTEFDRVAKGAGIKVVRTAVRAPLMNARCERFLGSAKRECLDHTIILGRRHLEHVLRAYSFSYFNTSRPHQGIHQRIPIPSETKKYINGATVRSLPVLGGLHHDYQVAA